MYDDLGTGTSGRGFASPPARGAASGAALAAGAAAHAPFPALFPPAPYAAPPPAQLALAPPALAQPPPPAQAHAHAHAHALPPHAYALAPSPATLTSESSRASSPDVLAHLGGYGFSPFGLAPGAPAASPAVAPTPARAPAQAQHAESSASAARAANAAAAAGFASGSGSGGEGDADADADADDGDGDGAGGDAPKRSGRLGVKRRQKYTRSRTGCLGCRARRIKCDEGRPVCRRCQVAKRPCKFPDPEEPPRKGKGRGAAGSSDEDCAGGERDDGGDADDVPTLPAFTYGADDSFDLSPWPAVDGAAGGDAGPSNSALFGTTGLGMAAGAALAAASTGAAPAPTGNAGLDLLGQASHEQAEVVGKTTQWNAQGGAPMLSTPNFLLPWFPTAQERSLILHYCANAADLMMAIPSGLNPMLAINLPLALDSPRGANPSADALRITLLGIGAIHQAFLLARSGTATTAVTAAMFQYASTLRDAGKDMVRRAASREGGGATSDAALGASTALATIDIFFGGGGWQDNFNMAKTMVAVRGGPAEMLKKSTPKQITDGVTVSPARLMLEILAIYETFGCLTTGTEPTLISERWASWWFEKSASTYDDHSVEKQFGMSRVMVHLFSRIARLLARVAKAGRRLAVPAAVSLPPPTALGLDTFLAPLAPLDAPLGGAALDPLGPDAGRFEPFGDLDGLGAFGALDPFDPLAALDGVGAAGPSADRAASAATPPSTSLLHVDTATSTPYPINVLPLPRQLHTGGPGDGGSASGPGSGSGAGSTAGRSGDALADEALELWRDVDAWIDSLRSTTAEHERVQVGNRAYAQAMRILLLRMVYNQPRDDPRVQEAAAAVLQYCSISTAAMGMSIDLMWPAVIAGCCLVGPPRQWLLTLLEGFKTQCCFDVDTAARIIQEAWRRADAGEPGADWKPVCDDFGLQVLCVWPGEK